MDKYKDKALVAREERKIRKGCLLKRAYPTEAAAYQSNTQVYRCDNCGMWHRTSIFSKLESRVHYKHVNRKQ